MSKSEYNKTYYLNHPEIKEKAKIRERKKRAQIRRPFPYLLFVLVGLTTVLLLTEMSQFYGSWIRAGVLESLVLIFSVLDTTSKFTRYIYKFVTCGICALSIYGMSSTYLEAGIQAYRSEQTTKTTILELERTIKSKEEQRDQMLSKGWISAAKRAEAVLDELKARLDHFRTKFVGLKPIALHTTGIQIVSRFFLMLGNILLVQRLVESLEISVLGLKFQRHATRSRSNVVSIKRTTREAGKSEISGEELKRG